MDRPLKGRGVRDAYTTSQWLQKQAYLPDLILSSPATRAIHTALIFAKNLNYSYRDIELDERIYHAGTPEMVDIVGGLKNDYQSVFLFGHNPTITEYLNHCIDHRIDRVPTTGVACLQFDITDWSQAGQEAELLFFDYPKLRKSK
jgi:phosphohistidine phosphatase